MTTYKITRFYRDDRPNITIKTGLTLEEAQAHCNDPSTRLEGVWFDGYDEDQEQNPRPLWEIAGEIRAYWPKPYFGAEPYIEAMESLDKISDMYYMDDAADIVRYFLANAGTWHGETARSIKAELRDLIK